MNNKITNKFKDSSLNIVATLLLTKKIIKNKNKIFSNIISNIYYISDGDLGIFKYNENHNIFPELNENNIYNVLLRMFSLGYRGE